MTEKSHYLSYLLRIWQTGDEGEAVWRASLESPGTHQQWGFASLSDLCAFLKNRTETPTRNYAPSSNEDIDST